MTRFLAGITTAVTITPNFGDNARGSIDESTTPHTLNLYDGDDDYQLTCTPVGADPDANIKWYILEECADANNEPYQESFMPHDDKADCVIQNDIDNPATIQSGDSDVLDPFTANFADHDKCLRCEAEDMRLDSVANEKFEYQLFIRSKLILTLYEPFTVE